MGSCWTGMQKKLLSLWTDAVWVLNIVLNVLKLLLLLLLNLFGFKRRCGTRTGKTFKPVVDFGGENNKYCGWRRTEVKQQFLLWLMMIIPTTFLLSAYSSARYHIGGWWWMVAVNSIVCSKGKLRFFPIDSFWNHHPPPRRRRKVREQ